MWLMKTLLTSGCTNQRGAGQLKQAEEKGDVQISGNHAKLDEFLGYLDSFDFWFNMVTP